jgi:hypothetical protein
MGLTTVRMAVAGNQVSLTGLWSFKFSLVVDFDDESAGSQQIVTNVWLYEVGNTVFGTMGAAEHIVGSRDGINLSLDIVSFGSNDRDAKKDGIQQVSKMTLKLVGGNLIGEGVSLSPEPGIQAFEVYRVTAKRLIGRAKAGGDSSEALPGLPGWLCDALTAFLQKVFSRATAGLFAPMEVCDPSMNGRGYYLFGDTGPGAGREYGTVTIYVPWETLSFCPQDSLYAFTIHSKESYTPIDSLLSVLEKASELGDFFSIPLSDLVQKVRSFFDTYGNFAVSLGISTNTGSIYVYVNTSSGASEDICNKIANSTLVQAIREAHSLFGKEVGVICGHDIKDTFTLRTSAVPVQNFLCNTPVIFIYLLGTINVNYD